MKNRFSIEEVEKIARLSALELTEEELNNFMNQFSDILDYFELLNSVELSEVETEEFKKNIHNGRDDNVKKSKVFRENFSPYLQENFFKIPLVIDQEK